MLPGIATGSWKNIKWHACSGTSNLVKFLYFMTIIVGIRSQDLGIDIDINHSSIIVHVPLLASYRLFVEMCV